MIQITPQMRVLVATAQGPPFTVPGPVSDSPDLVARMGGREAYLELMRQRQAKEERELFEKPGLLELRGRPLQFQARCQTRQTWLRGWADARPTSS
jgi:hypothetical protein